MTKTCDAMLAGALLVCCTHAPDRDLVRMLPTPVEETMAPDALLILLAGLAILQGLHAILARGKKAASHAISAGTLLIQDAALALSQSSALVANVRKAMAAVAFDISVAGFPVIERGVPVAHAVAAVSARAIRILNAKPTYLERRLRRTLVRHTVRAFALRVAIAGVAHFECMHVMLVTSATEGASNTTPGAAIGISDTAFAPCQNAVRDASMFYTMSTRALERRVAVIGQLLRGGGQRPRKGP
eukprot:CAMPEP_0117539802 /NCGR_PEP_ID=MMETSP0784-20121206/43172_1 /TAXON_ID=39447 /ORGANISM="" /LENGTH=243 /DNA_ID=CAMNT_0005336439 /DNA_START=742 /DNA_END=1470 /DNA_ORIENTATION=+